MNRVFLSIIAVVVTIVGLLVFQMTRSTSSSVLLPSDLAQHQSTDGTLSRIRVGGRVTEDPIEYQLEPRTELKFSIADPGENGPSVQVAYQGLKPDMFASGRDVIIDGEFRDGTLYASTLLAQCPSKYEPPNPGE